MFNSNASICSVRHVKTQMYACIQAFDTSDTQAGLQHCLDHAGDVMATHNTSWSRHTLLPTRPGPTNLPIDGNQEQTVNNWALFIVNNVIILLTLLGNTITLFLIARNRKLQSVTNSFVVSLACADLLMGCIYPLYNVLNYTTFYANYDNLHVACSLSLYFIIVSAGVSNLSLLAVSVDRYVAVVQPLRYRVKVTRWRANVAIVSIWLYIIMASLTLFVVYGKDSIEYYVARCSLLNLIPEWYFFGIILPHMLTPSVISKVLYGRIMRVANKLEAKTYDLNACLGVVSRSKKEYKAAKLMAIIMILFILCWAPYITFHIVIHAIGTDSPDWLFTALELSKVLSVSSACINPLVYTWKSKGFRSALKRTCGCSSDVSSRDDDMKDKLQNRSASVSTLTAGAELAVTL